MMYPTVCMLNGEVKKIASRPGGDFWKRYMVRYRKMLMLPDFLVSLRIKV